MASHDEVGATRRYGDRAIRRGQADDKTRNTQHKCGASRETNRTKRKKTQLRGRVARVAFQDLLRPMIWVQFTPLIARKAKKRRTAIKIHSLRVSMLSAT